MPLTVNQAKSIGKSYKELLDRIDDNIKRRFIEKTNTSVVEVDLSEQEYNDDKLMEYVRKQYASGGWKVTTRHQDCASDSEHARGDDWNYYYLVLTTG